MDWQDRVRSRYSLEGSKTFSTADTSFKELLSRLCKRLGISMIDDNPEGQDWLILLKDGTELLVQRRSYETGNMETDFWIEYSPEHGGVVAEFPDSKERPIRREIIVPNADIAAVCDDW